MTRAGEGHSIGSAIHVDPPLRYETGEEGAVRSTIPIKPTRFAQRHGLAGLGQSDEGLSLLRGHPRGASCIAVFTAFRRRAGAASSTANSSAYH
ncbi:hypothetical protein [Methylobacterium tarhaniae]|uniref:hypothetical protein n=1 Tax=Methylobacterium tarhaniae TaxID=1187852 RepID=UPI003D02910D